MRNLSSVSNVQKWCSLPLPQVGLTVAQGVDKSYSSGFNLKEHIRIVHDKKDLACGTCERKYKSHKAWSIHQRSCQKLPP